MLGNVRTSSACFNALNDSIILVEMNKNETKWCPAVLEPETKRSWYFPWFWHFAAAQYTLKTHIFAQQWIGKANGVTTSQIEILSRITSACAATLPRLVKIYLQYSTCNLRILLYRRCTKKISYVTHCRVRVAQDFFLNICDMYTVLPAGVKLFIWCAIISMLPPLNPIVVMDMKATTTRCGPI